MQKGRLEELVVGDLLQDLLVAVDAAPDLGDHVLDHRVRLLEELLVSVGQLARVLLLVLEGGLEVAHLQEEAHLDHQLLRCDVHSGGLTTQNPADGAHLLYRVQVETALLTVIKVEQAIDLALVADHGSHGEILNLFDCLNVVRAAHELRELVKLEVVDENHSLLLHHEVLNP